MTAPPAGMSEFEFIDWMRARIEGAEGVRLGPGDDCAVLDLRGRDCLVTTDSVIAGVHFDPAQTTPEQIGRKALARAVSDIAAMAAEPFAVVACVMLPRGYAVADAQRLFLGMAGAAHELGVAIVGGDVASGAAELVLAVTAIGRAAATPPVQRSGAQIGDRILVTGALGGSLLGHHLDFTPRLREALALAAAVELHAMIDISDGLAADLNHICEESRCAAVVHADRIPIADAARTMAASSGRTPLEHAIGDGEDYELLFTCVAGDAAKAAAALDGMAPVADIGEIVAGRGMTLIQPDGRRSPLDAAGWVHRVG